MVVQGEPLSPVARFLLLTAAFVIVVAGMKQAASLLVPFLLSVFIAMLCSPLLSWLRARRVPSGVAISLIILSVVLAGIAVGAVVGGAVRDFNNDLPQYQLRLQEMSSGLVEWLVGMGVNADPQQLKEVINPAVAMKMAGNVVAGFSDTMANAFMILLTVIFILAEEAGFAAKLVHARGGSTGALEALERFSKVVNNYMGLKTLISLGTGLLAYILLLIIGVDYAVMWAMLAFLLNFVPTVGSILAALPPTLLALVQLGPFSALWTAVGYLAINTIVGNGIEPRVMGKGLNLSALVVFLSLVFWGWALGMVGMLLSIPLTIMVKIALENNESTRWIGLMLGAGDEAEAEVKSRGD
ncbi:AI-2E family transporter [Porticoccus sp. GXU_MW_L64]